MFRLTKFSDINKNDVSKDFDYQLFENNEENIDDTFKEEIDHMSYVNAAIFVLKRNGNKPMTSQEIWSEAIKFNLMNLNSKKAATMGGLLNRYSINTSYKYKLRPAFRITDVNPYKFVLLDPNEPLIDEPLETEDVVPASIKIVRSPVKNPFGGVADSSAICVLGESGTGKSVTIENILENSGHKYEFILPTATTTGLLSQYSSKRNTYTLSRLGKMLIEAKQDPFEYYTAVFDEMHKSNVMEMINDELLQAISKRRNNGKRYISLDKDTAALYKGNLEDFGRNSFLIPDNFGFIFISSKEKVIKNNPDFYNRVDIVNLTPEDRDIEDVDEFVERKMSEI